MHELADIVLPDQDGTDVRIGDLWADRPVALVWLRHYGWVHCRDHAVQLHRAREQFEQAGVDLVLIGQATPRHAKHFAKKLDLDGETILADEQRQTYKIAGFKKAGVSGLLGPKSVVSGLKHSARSGVVQGRVIGDAAQLGGAMVVDTTGEVVFRQASENAGDTIEPADLLAAARSAA